MCIRDSRQTIHNTGAASKHKTDNKNSHNGNQRRFFPRIPVSYTHLSDANGKYAPVSATFTATTDTVMASYDEYEGKLVAAADITAEQFVAFTKTVSKVKIGDQEYAASGKGAVKIVQEDGTLDYSKTAVNLSLIHISSPSRTSLTNTIRKAV